ncbi:MDR family MFS transporter [Bhargavaea beijingensis]|uniref:Drug resistance transporter, EmrB/QacA subfamily n=1 Tax=Bhargavaea beijingensis TaxID=426756 RepID=A0A1G7G6R5_9BACL|nr:MDR family MFS transporter [Bhargavaea beijingensis]MCW1927412.1 DHA2 family efflux MFS transporter permease subunit [Bhargavaea beijingensis]SDE83810.1 drug resistance transporter, EmrB/QacA subfamily [Bhargavaea beijingensis]
MQQSEQSAGLPAYNRTVILIVLITGAFVALLNQTLLIVALPPIMNDFSIDANLAQWVTTAYLLTNGILIPVTAFLIERFSSRRLLLAASALFAAGTLVASVAPSFFFLLVARVIQAAGAGMMMPLMQTILLTIFPVNRRGSVMGLVGLAIGFAPAIGPTLGGWVLSFGSWRMLFTIVLPLAVLHLIAVVFFMKNVTRQRPVRIDHLSVVLSTLGFGGLLYAFSSIGGEGWLSLTVLISTAVGAAALFLFIRRQLSLETPILNFSVFRSRVYRLIIPMGMITFALLIGTETLLPLYIQNVRGGTAFESGLLLLPGAIAMGAMSPFSGRIFDRFGAGWLVVTGFALQVVTTVPFVLMTPDTPLVLLGLVFGLRMLGLSMLMMPLSTAGINSLPGKLIPHGTAMDNTFRQIGGSIGTALLVSIMTGTAVAIQPMPDPPPSALMTGVRVAFLMGGILAVAGFILALRLKKLPAASVPGE